MEMTEREWKIADALARAMAPNVDANEVGKVLAFWRRWHDPKKVFDLVKRLPESGQVRSGRTRGYYEAMSRYFDQHLRDVRPEVFGLILGWSFRLMRYYQFELSCKDYRSNRRMQR
ncbi:MAG: hypothetical protein EHM14_06750 [Methanothrix sp.]|nr:MAG: hypothetical protein EHM14_06750 [Methanothrix sp.]